MPTKVPSGEDDVKYGIPRCQDYASGDESSEISGEKTIHRKFGKIRGFLLMAKFKMQSKDPIPNISYDIIPSLEERKSPSRESKMVNFEPVKTFFTPRPRRRSGKNSAPSSGTLSSIYSLAVMAEPSPRSRSDVFCPFLDGTDENNGGSGKSLHTFPSFNSFQQRDVVSNHRRRAFRERFRAGRLSKPTEEANSLTSGVASGRIFSSSSESSCNEDSGLGSVDAETEVTANTHKSYPAVSSVETSESCNMEGSRSSFEDQSKQQNTESGPSTVPQCSYAEEKPAMDSGFMEAIAAYSKTIETGPPDAETLLSRATAYYRIGRYSEAMVDATRAASIIPQSPMPHYQIGLIHKSLHDNNSAVKSFRTALELETTPPPRLVALTLKAESVLSKECHERLLQRTEASQLPEGIQDLPVPFAEVDAEKVLECSVVDGCRV